MQFGYAMSLGISRGVGNTFDLKWRADLYSQFERSLEELANSKHDLTPERHEKIIRATRAIKARYRQIWEEVWGVGDGAAVKTAPARR